MYRKIEELCKEKGISIRSLERELGFGNGTIGKWKSAEPSVLNLKQVADYLGISLQELTDEAKPK